MKWLIMVIMAVVVVVLSAGLGSVAWATMPCVVSPGCSSGVQYAVSGMCTSISNCSDVIYRNSDSPNTCFVDKACSGSTAYDARNIDDNTCMPISNCDSIYVSKSAAQGGTCSTSTTHCVLSPGCSSGVQYAVSGMCTSISNCSDVIYRNSDSPNTCYVDKACSGSTAYDARNIDDNTCMPISNCDSIYVSKSAAQGGVCESSTLSEAGFMHIPVVSFGTSNYWIDLQHVPTNDGKIMLELKSFGIVE